MSDNPDKKNGDGSGKKKSTKLGDFLLKKRLGKGGMGEVFLAKQISLDRIVAIKTLSKDLAGKDDFVARFLREARSMAKLDHSNVVKVYAVDSYKGVHYVAIEYVDGKSVQDWLDKLKKFSVADSVHITMVCAEAMKHAHDQNMVHRDIKPDNILLTSKGSVKVADFGLAKVIDDDVSMTQSGTGLGTPLYMAPEQARSAKTVDQRSDIYALGATLYHMLTGVLPFDGGSALELIIAKETGKYEPARRVTPEVPEKLDLIIDKMMMKDPKHRYSDCMEIVKDLGALGVHSDALSFIDGAQPTGVGRTVSPTMAMGSTMAGGAAGTSPKQRSGDIDSRKEAKAAARAKEGKKASRTWYVQYENAKGKTTVEKHSTGRVMKMITAGILTPKARAKASSDGAYLPLAKFPEFTEAIENQLSRKSAQVKATDMKSLYKQVERDQKKLNRWRWLTSRFRGAVGVVSLVLWLAIIGGVVWVCYTFGKTAFDWLGSKVQDMMG